MMSTNSNSDSLLEQFEAFDRQAGVSAGEKQQKKERAMAKSKVEDLVSEVESYTKQKTTWTAISLLSIFLQGLNFVALILMTIAVFGVANRPLPSLVQLTNGEVINTAPLGNKARTRAVLQRFVVETLTNLMTWQVEGNNNQLVSLRVKEESYSVPVTVWRASFAFSEDFRNAFLGELVSLMGPFIKERDASLKTAISFVEVSVPKKIEEGVWEISVVADIVIVNKGSSQRLPFSKVIKVRAVDTPPFEMLRSSLDRNSLQQDIFLGRQYGLEIIEMRDLI